MFNDGIKYMCRLYWWFIIDINDRQQAPPSLPFASPWAKLNLNNRSGVATMLSRLKSTHAFNQKFSSGLKKLIWLSNLPILPPTMGLLSLHLGLEQLKDRTIKSSIMSQVLCSTIVLEFFISFQNKSQRFHCMTLYSLNICGIHGSSPRQ